MTAAQEAAIAAAWAVVDDRPCDFAALITAYPYELDTSGKTIFAAAIDVLLDAFLGRRFFAHVS